MKKISGLILTVLLMIVSAQAQQAEITIQLNEQFFDALLDAIFKNTNPPEFPLSVKTNDSQTSSSKALISSFTENQRSKNKAQSPTNFCPDRIKLEREIDGTKTAVRFQDGRIFAP